MSDQKGQTGGPGSRAKAVKDALSVSRDDACASSGDPHQGLREPGHSLGFHHRILRRVLHVWFRLSRGMTMGVRAVVLDAEGRVFLVRHSYVPGWHLPGGGVEAGQTTREALEMELLEEGNLVMSGEPVLFGIYLNRIAAPRDHVLLYVVREFCQSTPRAPDHEIVESGFYPVDALPVGVTEGTRRRIREVMADEIPAPIW